MLVLLLNVSEAIKDTLHVIGLVGVGHFPLQGFEFVVQIADASAACDRFIQDRTALHFLDVLAKVADRQLLGEETAPSSGVSSPTTIRNALSCPPH